MRQIQITIPNDKIESVIEILKNLGLVGIFILTGEEDSLIFVRTRIIKESHVVEELNKIGVGVTFGIIDIVELKATIPPLQLIEDKEKDAIESRVAVEEIYNDILRNASLTKNYLVFIIISAIVAAIGLITNNPAIVVASMVIAPLMGPVLALSYGWVIKDNLLIKESMKTELIGFAISVSIGWLFGIGAFFMPTFQDISTLPTEIVIRGELDSIGFVLNIILAIAIGIAVGFSLTGGISSALVGIAIGASIMPPVVNIGICMFLGLYVSLGFWIYALNSLIIFVINFVCIILVAYIVFRLKKVRAPIRTWANWRGPKLPKKKEEVDKPPQEKAQQTRFIRRLQSRIKRQSKPKKTESNAKKE